MKYVANVRKELSIRTIFNILGPLTNPAGASMQVLGVYEKELVEPLIDVLSNLGVESAVSVYGLDGMDEISASDKTFVCELKDGKKMSYEISPEYFGMELASLCPIILCLFECFNCCSRQFFCNSFYLTSF